MRRNHSRMVLDLFHVLVTVSWWSSVVMLPVTVAMAVLRRMGVLSWNAMGNIPVSVVTLTPGPPGVAVATGQVDVVGLPLSTALPAGVLWLGSVAGVLAVLWQLKRIAEDLQSRPLEPGTARRMRRLGPLLAVVTVVGVGLQAAAAKLVVQVVPMVGWYVDLQLLFAGLGAAAVAVLFAEAVRVATALREDQELTI